MRKVKHTKCPHIGCFVIVSGAKLKEELRCTLPHKHIVWPENTSNLMATGFGEVGQSYLRLIRFPAKIIDYFFAHHNNVVRYCKD